MPRGSPMGGGDLIALLGGPRLNRHRPFIESVLRDARPSNRPLIQVEIGRVDFGLTVRDRELELKTLELDRQHGSAPQDRPFRLESALHAPQVCDVRIEHVAQPTGPGPAVAAFGRALRTHPWGVWRNNHIWKVRLLNSPNPNLRSSSPSTETPGTVQG